MRQRKSSIEIMGMVKRYLSQGLTQPQIAKLMDMSRQRLFHWVKKIREEE